MLFTNRFTYPFYKEERGLSLVSTLWILTILSILAAQLLYSIHIEQRTQRNFLDRGKYHYAAKAGFEWTLAVMRTDQTPFDSLGESWAAPITGQVADGIQTGKFLNYNVAITDEASKVNINAADVGLISNLLAQVGASPDDAQTEELANAIVEGQPYRTVRDLARAVGMTSEFLYGPQQMAAPTQGVANTQSTTGTAPGLSTAGLGNLQNTSVDPQPGLVDLATIYSIDTSTDSNGEPLINVNTADTQQLTQIETQLGQVFSEAEAESLIQQREFDKFAALMDVQAVSDDLFNNIRDKIIAENPSGETRENNEEDDDDGQININTADVETLESLDGVDRGIADRIIDHRNSQGFFQNIDAIKDVKILTQQEFIGIVDKITLKDGDTRSGLVNINTASPEVLALLPGMDLEKARAIVERREQDAPDDSPIQNYTDEEIQGNPFTSISQLSEMEEINFETFREVADSVTYRSHGYRIEANGVDAAGRIVSTCIGIIDRTGDQVIVQYWRQN